MFEDFQGFGARTVDESMTGAEMQGPSSTVNQRVGNTWTGSATKSLVVLWFAVLALYWFLGWLFKGRRGGK